MFKWDPVTENHVVPVHREMCKYTIIPSSPRPIEHRVPLNPRIPPYGSLLGGSGGVYDDITGFRVCLPGFGCPNPPEPCLKSMGDAAQKGLKQVLSIKPGEVKVKGAVRVDCVCVVYRCVLGGGAAG